MMRKKILLLLLVMSSAFISVAQMDTTVTRLRKDLSAAKDPETRMMVLKELIDMTVLMNEEECVGYINQAIFLAEETRDRKKMAQIRLHAARAFLTQGGRQSLLNRAEQYCNEALKISKGAAGLEKEEIMAQLALVRDRKSTRLNSSHITISYAVFCLAN